MYLDKVTSPTGHSICTLNGKEIPLEAFEQIGDLLYANNYQVTKALELKVTEILDSFGVPIKYIDYNVSRCKEELNQSE